MEYLLRGKLERLGTSQLKMHKTEERFKAAASCGSCSVGACHIIEHSICRKGFGQLWGGFWRSPESTPLRRGVNPSLGSFFSCPAQGRRQCETLGETTRLHSLVSEHIFKHIEGTKMHDTIEIQKSIKILVDQWCERRCLTALKYILQGWPLSSGLTDDWAELL